VIDTQKTAFAVLALIFTAEISKSACLRHFEAESKWQVPNKAAKVLFLLRNLRIFVTVSMSKSLCTERVRTNWGEGYLGLSLQACD
jgi:hypothetical protein